MESGGGMRLRMATAKEFESFGSCDAAQLSFSRLKSEVISSTGQNSLRAALSQAQARPRRRADIGSWAAA